MCSFSIVDAWIAKVVPSVRCTKQADSSPQCMVDISDRCSRSVAEQHGGSTRFSIVDADTLASDESATKSANAVVT